MALLRPRGQLGEHQPAESSSPREQSTERRSAESLSPKREPSERKPVENLSPRVQLNERKPAISAYEILGEEEDDLNDDSLESREEDRESETLTVSDRRERRKEQFRRMTLTPRRISTIEDLTSHQNARGPIHMVPILQWPEFKGEKGEDPVRFLSDFEEIAMLEKKDQDQKLLVLARCLKGRAIVVSDWIRTSVAARHGITYEDASKKLLSLYGKRYQANNLYQDFFRMRQKREETAGEYLLRLQAAANLLDRDFSEEEIMYQFVDGLRPELYSRMRDKEFYDEGQALRCAEKLERRFR
jgi:hypothetical protein